MSPNVCRMDDSDAEDNTFPVVSPVTRETPRCPFCEFPDGSAQIRNEELRAFFSVFTDNFMNTSDEILFAQMHRFWISEIEAPLRGQNLPIHFPHVTEEIIKTHFLSHVVEPMV